VDLDLRKVRYFVAVAEELNFGRAAQALHIAQPVLSRQIRALEQELKVQLLERDKRATRLTPAGEALLEDGRALLAAADAARRRISDVAADERVFTVGFMPGLIVTPAVSEFSRLHPEVTVEVLRTDYIKFARARGLPNRAIYFGHALKNTLVPVITIIGLQLGMVIAFSLVTETVFQWPGVGLLLVQSVAVADIPVMSAYLLLVAVVFVTINLVVDLLYFAVDPRLRVERRAVAAAR